MEQTIPGFVGHTIDEAGIVRAKCPYEIVEPEIGRRGNEYRVAIKNDMWKVVRPKVSRLVLTTFRPVKGIDYNWLSPIYRNGNVADCSLENLEWDFSGYTPPIDVSDPNNNDIFVTIPGFSSYQVTPSGIIRNKNTTDILTPGLSSAGYLCVRITDDNGKSTYVGVHHLMARALLDHPHDVDQLVTNHLNGVKTDNRVANLEWASYSRNIHHAHYTGLRTELVRVFAKNAETGEVKLFLSINDTARFFGNSNPGKIHWWLYHGNSDKIREGWFVSLAPNWNLETCPPLP